jgi:hypothetical protein
MTNTEAAKVLGLPITEVERLQGEGLLPNPVPDDYLDPIMQFRIDLEKAHRRKMDRFSRGEPVAND